MPVMPVSNTTWVTLFWSSLFMFFPFSSSSCVTALSSSESDSPVVLNTRMVSPSFVYSSHLVVWVLFP